MKKSFSCKKSPIPAKERMSRGRERRRKIRILTTAVVFVAGLGLSTTGSKEVISENDKPVPETRIEAGQSIVGREEAKSIRHGREIIPSHTGILFVGFDSFEKISFPEYSVQENEPCLKEKEVPGKETTLKLKRK